MPKRSPLRAKPILRYLVRDELHSARHPSDAWDAARILRLLATHNIFREVTPNVFANNRISSALDKGKPSSVLFEKSVSFL
jgi:hypothetical protein